MAVRKRTKIKDILTGRVCNMYRRFVDKDGKPKSKEQMIAIYQKNKDGWDHVERDVAVNAITIALSGLYRMIGPDEFNDDTGWPRLVLIGSQAEKDYEDSYGEYIDEMITDDELEPVKPSDGEMVLDKATKDAARMKMSAKMKTDLKKNLKVMDVKDAEVALKVEDDEEEGEPEETTGGAIRTDWNSISEEDKIGMAELAHQYRYGPDKMNYEQIAKEIGTTKEIVSELFKLDIKK